MGSSKGARIFGNVYDEDGDPVTGAVVTINSLDKSVPYTSSVSTSEGAWMIDTVPEGANIEMIASKVGWTRRRQVTSLQTPVMVKNEVNFGSAGSTTTDRSAAYFISNHPEIERFEWRTETPVVNVSTLVYKLRVSEPLSPQSKENLVRALRIWPANRAAAGRAAADAEIVDFMALSGANDHDGTDGYDFDQTVPSTQGLDHGAGLGRAGEVGFVIREGSTFRGNPARRAKAVWDQTGAELTFSFDAPLLAPRYEDARYQVGLVSLGANPLDRIEDLDGYQLGTSGKDASLTTYPAAGRLIANAFRALDLMVGKEGTPAKRWAATHHTVLGFGAERDELAPKLLRAAVADDVQGHTRIALTFSEPLAAFDGTDVGFAAETLLGQRTRTPDGGPAADLLANYTFALGPQPGATQAVALDGVTGGEVVVDPTAVASFGGGTGDLGREFRFAPASLSPATGVAPAVSDPRVSQARPGTVFLEVDGADPATLLIWIVGRPGFFPAGVRELKAYAAGLADPAGNAITRSAGAANVVYALH